MDAGVPTGSYSDGVKRDGTMGVCTAYNGMSGSASGRDGHAATCTGWKPVGDSTTAFTGSLQGGGYTIRNLYINISTTIGTTRGGLFGQTGSASLIQNVGVTDAFIKVDTISSSVGGLVGSNSARIRNSYATGTVTGGRGGFSSTGGIVGSNNSARIRNSYATGTVTGGSDSNTGGLMGYNTGSISDSYATSTVIGSGSESSTGGLVGVHFTGSISNSYATGSVSGASSADRLGGLVGDSTGSISNSYASGSVSGSSRSGGLVGNNTGSITGQNYFVDEDGTNGIGRGTTTCAGSCTRATGADDDARKIWLQNTLDESESPDGMGWLPANWENFVGTTSTGIGYPKLKYAQVSYCSASPATLTTKAACTAAGTCVGATGSDRATCVGADRTWTPHTWLTEGCGGTTGVRCGTRIGGQDSGARCVGWDASWRCCGRWAWWLEYVAFAGMY